MKTRTRTRRRGLFRRRQETAPQRLQPTPEFEPVAHAPAPAPEAPSGDRDEAPATAPTREPKLLLGALATVAILGTLGAGVVGFWMSFDTLSAVASTDWHFGAHGFLLPLGVDVSIIGFLALDLYMVRKRAGWPGLRLIAHAMTGATVYFNVAAQGPLWVDPARSAAHGIMPVLFVIGATALRRLVIRLASLEVGGYEGIPLSRWVLNPGETWILYRRMRLWGVPSFRDMQQRQKDLRGYEVGLRQQYPDLEAAPYDLRLPMILASEGYTVQQALDLPAEQARRAAARAAREEQQQLDDAVRSEEARAEADIRKGAARARVAVAAAETEAETAAAAAAARARRAVASLEADERFKEAQRAAERADRAAWREEQDEVAPAGAPAASGESTPTPSPVDHHPQLLSEPAPVPAAVVPDPDAIRLHQAQQAALRATLDRPAFPVQQSAYTPEPAAEPRHKAHAAAQAVAPQVTVRWDEDEDEAALGAQQSDDEDAPKDEPPAQQQDEAAQPMGEDEAKALPDEVRVERARYGWQQGWSRRETGKHSGYSHVTAGKLYAEFEAGIR